MEEFPQLREVVDGVEKDPTNVDIVSLKETSLLKSLIGFKVTNNTIYPHTKTNQALEYLGKSKGIQRARELAMEHANLAAAAIGSLPETDNEDVKRSRRALIDLTHRVITRNK